MFIAPGVFAGITGKILRIDGTPEWAGHEP
jgi:hypothetical protein